MKHSHLSSHPGRNLLLQDEEGEGPPRNMNPHETAKIDKREETMEARAKRIASQWVKDGSAEAPEPAAPQVPGHCFDRQAPV